MSTRSLTAPHRTFVRVYIIYTRRLHCYCCWTWTECVHIYAQVYTTESDLFGCSKVFFDTICIVKYTLHNMSGLL